MESILKVMPRYSGWEAQAIAAVAAFAVGTGARSPAPQPVSPIVFENVSAAAGLSFVLDQHPTSEKFMVETMAGGLAVFDYDGDGLPDIFFTNGAPLPSLQKHSPADWNRLFRNTGGLRFTDVTEQAGVRGDGYATGAAAGDYDNDGHIDLFVAGVQRNQLLRNAGDGRFQDVTVSAGIRIVRPPFEPPRIDLKQIWHRKFHHDARSRWLRSLMCALFQKQSVGS